MENLRVNGSNFVSDVAIDADVFAGNLTKVVIEVPEDEEFGQEFAGTHFNMELVRCEMDEGAGGFCFAIREIPEGQLREVRVDSRLDYLEMINDM